MQRVGKINRGGAAGQGKYFAVRGEHVDGVVKQLGLKGAGQVGTVGFGHVFAPVEQLAQPGDFLLVGAVALAAFFVAPVRRHAEFGKAVHIESADLYFHALVLRPHHHGVQAAVVVGFGVGDVVVEFAANRLPQAVHNA